jgi:gliding motility-associated-like protein
MIGAGLKYCKYKLTLFGIISICILSADLSLAQNCLVSPPIEGENCDNCVAPGWEVYSLTPDISSPDVPIPVGCTFSNPPGPSPSGGAYQLLLGDAITEGIKITFDNLVDGEEYCFAVWWVGIDGDDCSLTAGDLQIVVQGNTTEFNDATEWELAEVTFTALSSSVTIIVKMKPGSTWIGLLVDDAVCSSCCVMEVETPEELTLCPDEAVLFDASYTGEGDSISFEWFCEPLEGLDYLNFTDILNPVFTWDENDVISYDTLFFSLKVWLDGCVKFSDLMLVLGDENIPVFDFEVCSGDADFIFPPISEDDYSGIWTGNFDFENLGGTIEDYIFYIDEGQNNCIEQWTYSIPIEAAQTPNFDLDSFYCVYDDNVYTLPPVSEEGIEGSWDVSSFNPMDLGPGTYNFLFSPNLDLACAYSYTLTISVQDEQTVNFNIPDNFCSENDFYILPETSLEGITGVWNLPIVDLSIPTSSIFLVFYPDNFLSCYTPFVYDISISAVDLPSFNVNTVLCESDDPILLPNVSDNGYIGTWDTNLIDPANINGVLITTFTPNPNLYTCVEVLTLEFSVQSEITPEFELPEIFCAESGMYVFPDTTLNGIMGDWLIDTLNLDSLQSQYISNSFSPVGSDCYISLDIEIPIISSDSILVQASDPSSCALSDGIISLSSASNAFEFSLDTGNTWSSSIYLDSLTSGAYFILYQESLFHACKNSFEIILVSPELPEITGLSANAISDCGLVDGSIIISAEGSAIEYSIDHGQNWQPDSTFNDLAAGNYTIWVQPNGMPGCIDSLSTVIDAPLIPQIDSLFITPVSDCDSLNGFIEVFSDQIDVEFSIDNGLNWQSDSIFNELTAGEYTLNIRSVDALNCSLDTIFTITAPAPPVLDNIITSDPTDCDSNDGSLMVEAIGSQLEYSIDNGISWQSSPLFENLSSGMYEISIREINSISCNVEGMAELASSAVPNLSYTITPPTVCDENIGVIQVSSDIANVEFSIDGGGNWNSTGIFQGLSAGQYEIIAHEVNQIACETSIIINIVANPDQPQIINTNIVPPSFCNGEDGSVQLTVDIFDTEFSIDGGQSWKIVGIFNGLSAGDYTVLVQKAGNPDCLIEFNFTIDDPPCPCNELSINSVVQSVNCTDPLSGTIEITDITGWIFPGDYTITWSNGDQDLILENLETGWYSYQIDYDLNCSWTDSIFVGELIPIEFDWVIEDVDCFEFGAIEMINITGGSGNYLYSIDGISFQSDPLFENLATGAYILYVQDDENCITTQNVQLDLTDELTFEFGDIEPIYEGDTIFLVPFIPDMNIDSFYWSPSSAILNTGELVAQVSPNVSTEYTLTVFAGPCVFSQSILLEVLERETLKLYVPNVFSPNNDGINDVFYVQGQEIPDISLKELLIFDKWGNQVFQFDTPRINDPSTGWDGTMNERNVQTGVYTYVLLYEQNGQSLSRAGTISVLR